MATSTFRQLERSLALQDRGGERWAKCDLCGKNRPTDYHEIVNRGRTMGNEEARQVSYRRTLCAWLCRECHDKAHTPAIRDTLFFGNMKRYGAGRVSDDFALLEQVVDVRLPVAILTEVKDLAETICEDGREFGEIVHRVIASAPERTCTMQEALAKSRLTQEEFSAGLEWCIRRRLVETR